MIIAVIYTGYQTNTIALQQNDTRRGGNVKWNKYWIENMALSGHKLDIFGAWSLSCDMLRKLSVFDNLIQCYSPRHYG